MQELLSYIVKAIVRHPEAVEISQVVNEDGTHITLRLTVDPEDMGLIIGKDGNVARALRNIVKVSAVKQNKRVYIDILESGADQQADESTIEENLTESVSSNDASADEA